MKRHRIRRICSVLGLALLLAATITPRTHTINLTAASSGLGAISGTVTNIDARAFGFTVVSATPVGFDARTQEGYVTQAGQYTISNLEPGKYRVRFVPGGGTRAWEYYGDTRTTDDATLVKVEAGATTNGVDAHLEEGGFIRAKLSADDPAFRTTLSGYVVAQYLDGNTWRDSPSEDTGDANQVADVGGLATGTYRLRFVSVRGGTTHPADVASGYLGGTDDPAGATPVHVTAGSTTAVNFHIRRGAHIQGRVTNSQGLPVADVRVSASYLKGGNWNQSFSSTSDSQGKYEIVGLDSDTYILQFSPPDPYQQIYSGGVYPDLDDHHVAPPDLAGKIPVKSGQTATSNVTVQRAGLLSGTVRNKAGIPIAGVTVLAAPQSDSVATWAGQTATTDALGRYSFPQRPRKKYRLQFLDPSGRYATEYYNNATTKEASGTVDVLPETTVDLDTTLSPPEVTPHDSTPTFAEDLEGNVAGLDLDSFPAATWSWTRDGVPIPGATDRAYTVVKADYGTRLGVTFRPNAAGITGPALQSEPTSPVRLLHPHMTIHAYSEGRGEVLVHIKAAAYWVGRYSIDARVEVFRTRRGPDLLTTRTMHDNSLHLVLRHQPRGRQTYSVRIVPTAHEYGNSNKASDRLSVH
jgi:hypothetical protein